MFGREVEECCGQQRQISQIATEPADGVERGRQVIAAGPVADAERGAVAREPAESRRASHGAAGIGPDSGESRTFLNGRCCTAGGSSRQQRGIGRLQAVSVIAIFAGDAVGKLVEVRFASDDGAGVAQARGDPGVHRWVLFMGRIKLGAAACRESG